MHWSEHHYNLFEGSARFFKPSYIGNLLNHWLPAITGMVERLEGGITVVDLGCGHGIPTLIMAEVFPAKAAGFEYFRRATETSFNRVFELRP